MPANFLSRLKVILLHTLTSYFYVLHLLVFFSGEGPFKHWLDGALKLGVEERSVYLAGFEELAKAHESCARDGETDVSLEMTVEHHFICYTNVGGKLYQIGE